MKTKSILPLLAWCAAIIPAARAHQPQPIDVQIVTRVSAAGRSTLILTNGTRQMVTLVLSPGNLSTVKFSPLEITLGPLGIAERVIDTPALADGIQAIQVASQVTAVDSERTARPGPGLHEVLRVRAGAVEKISYEEAYLAGRRQVPGESETIEIPLGDGAIEKATMPRQSFAARPVIDARIAPLDLPEPASLLGMKPRQLPSFGDASYLEPSGIGLRAAAAAERSIGNGDTNDPEPPTPSSMIVSGKWLVRLPTGFDSIYSHEPGWGWTVRAWQYDGAKWRHRGSTTIGTTGDYKLFLSGAVPGQQMRLVFSTQNRFVSLTEPSGVPYSWSYQTATSTNYLNVGTQMADMTAAGDTPGLFYLFNGGVRLWNKFSSYGVNVLRDQPIQVTFPNTLDTGECQEKDKSGTKFAWSCAYWDTGKIWIIPDHADSTVVMHEIAHSVNAYFWGKMPEDAGGPHTLTGCYKPGLALTEGFANFVAYWVKVDRAHPDPSIGYLGGGLETTEAGVCTGHSNETRVAALLWDVHDTHADGPGGTSYDNWYFTKPFAVPAIYLNNQTSDILEFQQIYKNILGSSWATPIDNVFRLNRLIW